MPRDILEKGKSLILGDDPNVQAAIAAAPDREAAIDALNTLFKHHSATAVMRAALHAKEKIALVSSFGAESVVLLHMLAVVNKSAPVLFIDTEMLFPETLDYQVELANRLGLSNLQIIKAETAAIDRRDPDGTLHQFDTDACCALRKTEPLQQALAEYDGWITGRKRFQSGRRSTLEFFEIEDSTARIKVNPLTHWNPEIVQEYMVENNLPRHPLVAKGYPSIGCEPCTSPVEPGEDPRAGRWRNQSKDECGIHLVDGKFVRIGETS